jgi:Helicase conserved C-terminal domain
MTERIRDLLLAYDANVLKAIAREHGIDTKSLNKDAVAEQLERKFATREYVERALRQASSFDRAVLTRVQRAGGAVAVSALKSALVKEKLLAATPPGKKQLWGWNQYEPYEGNPRYSGKPALEDVVARLTLLGLAFSREIAHGNRQVLDWSGGRYLVIPEEIRAFLPAVEEQKEQAPEPAHIVPASARILMRDLSRYWSYVRRNEKLELQSQGWLYKKTLTELLQLLGWKIEKKHDEKGDLHLYFLRKLLVALHLLKPEEENGWYVENSTEWYPVTDSDFWSRPPMERVKAAFEAWRDTDQWNELRIPATSYGADHRRRAPAELKEARGVILKHLKRLGAGQWVSLAALHDDIRLADYEFLFPRRPRGYSTYGYRTIESTPYYQANNPYSITYKNIENEEQGWDKVEGAIINHIVTGPLHWLGLTDLGVAKEGETPVAYRLTALGAWLLGIGAPVAVSEEGGRVVVQPNFQIVALEPIADGVLMTLDEFAQFEGGDHALTYRLTRETVYRGQRAGWDAPRVIAYLEQKTGTLLPQNVRRSLEEWQTQHERLTIRRNVPLVQAEDGATLEALFKDGALAATLGRRAAENVALPDRKAEAVTKALREAGWLPVVTRAGQFDAPASMTADETGQIELFARAPSIFAYGAIEPFAEILDARHAQLTRGSVREAVRSGIAVPEMLDRLEHVQRGAVPPKLVQRVKAWGHFYGDARLGQLTLVEFRDEAARAELLDDPELKPYLTRFEAGARPLALVRTAELARVKELLAARGIALREFEND